MNIKRFSIALWAFLCIAGSVLAASGPVGMTPSASNAADSARNNLLISTTHVTPLDKAFNAAGNAAAYFSPITAIIGSPNLELVAAYWYNLGATVTCTASSNQVVVTMPAGVTFPSYQVTASGNTKRIILPGCAAASGTANNQINTITGTGPYTLTLDATMGTSVTISNFLVYPGLRNFGSVGGPATSTMQENMLLTQCTVTAGGVSVVCPSNSFLPAMDMTETSEMGRWSSYILIHDPSGTCPDFKSPVSSSTSTTATLVNAPTCAIANTNYVQLYTGPLVIDSSMVGYGFDLPNAGVTTAGNTADWKPTLSSVTDPFHGVMSSNASTTYLQGLETVIAGTDDTTALTSMASYAIANGIAQAYFPYGHDYYFATPDMTNLATLALCSDGPRGGHIYYPQDQKIMRNVGRCTSTRSLPPVTGTLDPKLHFRQASAQPNTVTVDVIGDSMIVANTNALGEYGSLSRLVTDQIQAANPLKTVVFNNRAIGGTTICYLDPTGPNCSGNGSGIPASSQIGTVSQWYTNASNTWMSYVLADCPDVIVIRFSNDLSSLLWSSFWNVNGYTQTSAWRTTCGSNPDIVWVSPGTIALDSSSGPSAYSLQESELFISQFIRSAILSGDTPAMANGGKVGLIDAGQRDYLYTAGWDEEGQPMRRAYGMAFMHAAPNVNAKPTWPIAWSSSTLKYGYTQLLLGQAANETALTFWASVGQLNFPLGNGSLATPVSAGGSTSTFTTGYPGNQLTVERDSGGNLKVTGYLFYVPSTGASCSITSGAASLVCSASVANLGYRYANIAVAGAGASTCPLSIGGSNCLLTTISNISTDGKTLTLGNNATATLTNASTAMVFYHIFSGPTVTNVPAQTNWFQGSQSFHAWAFETQGSRAYLHVNSAGGPTVFTSQIASFGGHYKPALSFTNSYTNPYFIVNTATTTLLSLQTEDDGTWPLYSVQTSDMEEWGNCAPNSVSGPYGGGCTAHASTLGILAYQDVLLANRQGLNFSFASSTPGSTVVAVDAGSATMPTGSTWLNLTPAGGLTSYTVTLPASPAPNTLVTISSTQTITTLTVSANTGQSVTNAPTTITATTPASLRWDALNSTWRRAQ